MISGFPGNALENVQKLGKTLEEKGDVVNVYTHITAQLMYIEMFRWDLQ